MENWKLVAGVLLVFVFGVLAGLLPGFYFTHRFPPPPLPPHMDHKGRDAAMLERLSRDLDLTDAQKAQVGSILGETSEKLDRYLGQAQLEVRKILDDGFAQMEKELTDAQKKKLRDLRERMEKNGRHGPPFP